MNVKNTICILLIFVSLVSCISESEIELETKLDSLTFDSGKALITNDNISSQIKNGIQFGHIILENNDVIKFWFRSHHIGADIGGAIYEYPNEEREFYGGYHCCEVQFPQTFSNVESFKVFVKDKKGMNP